MRASHRALLRAAGTSWLLASAAVWAAGAPAGSASQRRSAGVPSYVRGELIVKLRDAAPACVDCLSSEPWDSLAALLERHRVRAARPLFAPPGGGRSPAEDRRAREAVRTRFPERSRRAPAGVTAPDLGRTYLLTLAAGAGVAQAVAELGSHPAVAWAEPNQLARLHWLPDDPYYFSSGTWGQAYDDLWGLKRIHMEQVWDLTRGRTAGGSPIVVAVIDTGLDAAHEDIAANVWHNSGEVSANQEDDDHNGYVDDVAGWDFVTCDSIGCACDAPQTPDPIPQDGHGHGTHVAGIVAAVADNGRGIAGVAPGTVVMPLRALNDLGQGAVSELAEALRYAADNGADVINASWGGLGRSRTIEEALQYASALGVVVVTSAGNEYGQDVLRFFPASSPRVVTVAASNPAEDPFAFATGFSCRGARLDVGAPGVDVLSLRAAGTDIYGDASHVVGGDYYRADGTSMAAPHVAGVVAALLANRPALTADEVRQVLRASAEDTGYPGWDILTGFGRLDAHRALATAAGPTAEISSPALGTILLNASATAITGTAAGAGFGEYEIRYRRLDELFWTPIAGPSSTPVATGVLADWDLSALADGVYHLQLEATSGASGRSFDLKEAIVLHDEAAKSGWPIRLDEIVSTSSPVFGDLDRDGRQEIVLNTLSAVYAYRPNGAPLWRRAYDGTVSIPALADLDGDGLLEVAFEEVGCAGARLHVLRHDGSELWSRAVPIVTGFRSFPALAVTVGDVDLDGRPEILVPHPNDKLFVYSRTGKLLRRLLDHANGGAVAFGDLDGNGAPEIVAATVLPTGGRSLRQITYDRKTRKLVEVRGRWPVQVEAPTDPYSSGFSFRGPIVVDLDRDGKLEVVMPTHGKLSVVRFDGRPQPGWPRKLGRIDDAGHVAAGDLDGDQRPELVLGSWASGVYIFQHDGSLSQVLAGLFGETFEPPPVIADIDGDGRGEVVVNSLNNGAHGISNGLARVYAVDYDPASRTYVRSWARSVTTVGFFEDYFFVAPIIGDFDRNGRLDLLVASPLYTGSHLMAWELPGKAPRKGAAWPMFGHDARHTNRF